MANETALNAADRRFGQMERIADDGWETSWKDLRDYISPTRGHFEGDHSKDGDMVDHQKVLDGYATIAVNILASGLLSGMTSPNRPWFKLELEDDFLNDIPQVREWLDDTEGRVQAVINGSNIYQVLHGVYTELGTFGTGVFMVLDDFEDIVRAHSFTSGEYYLAIDHRGRVESFGREYYMTVEQMVEEFGKENVGMQVLADWNNNQRLKEYVVRHLIEPNDFKIDGVPVSKQYRSLYWVKGRGDTDFLAKRGFDRFPVVAPRWETTTTHQVYGKGPGWNALGDVKQLQKTIDDKLKIQEKLHNPPVTADADIEGFVNLVPGGVTRTNPNVPDGGVRPAYTVNDALNSFIEMETHLKENIDRFYFVNLFFMMIGVDKNNMTATEVAERQQEKVMMMGPILHRLQEELLDPLIDLVFDIMLSKGLLIPPPVELEGVDVKVRYISILAQAQEALGAMQIQRVIERVLLVAQADPSILDNFDMDELARQLNEMEGAPAKLLRDAQEIQAIREQRQQVQAAQEMSQIGKDGSTAVRNLAKAGVDMKQGGTGV